MGAQTTARIEHLGREHRRFAQLPQRETKISHHMNLGVEWATIGFRNLLPKIFLKTYVTGLRFCLPDRATLDKSRYQSFATDLHG
jgi:hypothetical protein